MLLQELPRKRMEFTGRVSLRKQRSHSEGRGVGLSPAYTTCREIVHMELEFTIWVYYVISYWPHKSDIRIKY
jgi:hypothetical protein